MFCVSVRLFPKQEKSPQPMSSIKTRMMFGRELPVAWPADETAGDTRNKRETANEQQTSLGIFIVFRLKFRLNYFFPSDR